MEMYSLKEGSKYLGVSIPYLRKLVRGKTIPHYRFGNRIKFERKELDLWVETLKQKDKEYTRFF